jgi:outer membrane protein assembly complex protein YaeT
MRAFRVSTLLLAVAICAVACKEDGTGVQVGAGVEVKELSFTGLKGVTSDQLRSVLATTKSSKLPWGDKQYFDRTEFEADLKRIIAFLADRGYPKARVRTFDVKQSDDQRSVRITIDIDEGEPLLVERIAFAGFEAIPDDHRRILERRLPLQVDKPLDRSLVQASREIILDEFRDHGYPRPSVEVKEGAGSDPNRRVVSYSARPGRIAYVGPIEISGAMSVDEQIVRRQLSFRSGDLFDQSKLRDSQRKLYSLELFNFVNVEQVAGAEERAVQGTEADRIPTRVTLVEGKHRRVNFGLGYGSEEQARAQVDWRHVNFFGGARTAGVLARYSSLDRGVRLNFKQPYLFTRRHSATLSAQTWFSDEPAFRLTTIGGRATINREFGRGRSAAFGTKADTTLALTYANEWEDYEIDQALVTDPTVRNELIALGLNPDCQIGPRCGTGAGQKSALILDGVRDTTGNILDAKSGYFANLHFEQAGRFLGGDFDYFEATGEMRFYQSIGSKVVVALRARAGSIDAAGDIQQAVPFFKRYFLGGATTLRGWGRFEVAPLSEEGNPIGGHSFAVVSAEVRVPITRKLSGVLFADGGNVWYDPWDVDFNDLRYDIGPGLRYLTPVGPIRLDVGFQLNPIEGLIVNGDLQKRPLRIHFSIGQAF